MNKPIFDDRDQDILDKRQSAYLERTGPQVGHWVHFADGAVRRISHIWDWGEPSEVSIQTSNGGSFYLGNGYMQFSGSLYSGIPGSTFKRTDKFKVGSAWFFHHNDACAHNGVGVMVKCAVWESCISSSDREAQ